jgi:hypothetical protein
MAKEMEAANPNVGGGGAEKARVEVRVLTTEVNPLVL